MRGIQRAYMSCEFACTRARRMLVHAQRMVTTRPGVTPSGPEDIFLLYLANGAGFCGQDAGPSFEGLCPL